MTTRNQRRADKIRESLRREEERESLPGGLFGTYWKGGIEGRDEARVAKLREWETRRVDAEWLQRKPSSVWEINCDRCGSALHPRMYFYLGFARWFGADTVCVHCPCGWAAWSGSLLARLSAR